MKLRHLYALGALLWALPLGILLAFQVFAVMAGASWVFFFGDNPWPDWSDWLLGVPPLTAGVIFVVGLTGWAWRRGRSAEGAADPRATRRRGRFLLLSGLVACLGAVAFIVGQQQSRDGERRQVHDKEAAFVELSAARHTIGEVKPVESGESGLTFVVPLSGARAGPYLLDWRLVESTYGVTLAEGQAPLYLQAGESFYEISLDQEGLAESYRRLALKGSTTGVIADTHIRLDAGLLPELKESEQEALPPREVDNWRRGFSSLRHESSTEVPWTFDLRGVGPE